MSYSLVFILLLLCWSTIQQQLRLQSPVSTNQNMKDNKSQKGKAIKRYKLISADTIFLLPLRVQGIAYNLQIDSGSSDLFIKGEKTPGLPVRKYSCGQPCIKSNKKYNFSYLDGDSVRTYEKSLSIRMGTQTFYSSVLVAYEAQNLNEDEGILGLSYPSLASNSNPTFIQTLINKRIIDKYSFGVNLNLQIDSTSHIQFGDFDQSSFVGSLAFFQFISQKECITKIDGISIGQNGLIQIQKGLFDTGVTPISIPKKHANLIQTSFKNQDNQCYLHSIGQFTEFYCKIGNFETLPNLYIQIDGSSFEVDKNSYIKRCQRTSLNQIYGLSMNEGIWYCETHISFSEEPILLIGDGFFNRYYAYFDLQNKRIGLAKNREQLSLLNIVNSQPYDALLWSSLTTRGNQ